MKRLLTVESKMSYSPLSQYDFQNLKDDSDIKSALNIGNIYLICRRPRLFFKDVSIDDDALSIKIFQRHTCKEFQFHVDLIQEHIWDGEGTCSIEIGQYLLPSSSGSWFDSMPKSTDQKQDCQEYDGIKVYKACSGQNKKFVLWLNPEKLIHLVLLKLIKAEVSGETKDLFSLLNYDVLYVGRTNDMHRRQTHHEHVQEILSLEHPQWGDLPAHEICLISLFVSGADEIAHFGEETKTPVYGKTDYYYDLEKALVRALDPSYNRDKFPKYPSDDKDCILHSKLNYDVLYYSFNIPIVLNCKGKQIRGMNDMIRVSKDGCVNIVDSFNMDRDL